MQNLTAAEKLTKAKASFIGRHPFFTSLVLPMQVIENAGIQTLRTDGEKIEYSPAFVDSLSLDEVKFVLAHEAMHCVFEHMFRRGARDPQRWNIATDYIINDLLSREQNCGVMPKCGLLDAAIVAEGKGTAEGVYACLPEQAPTPEPKPGEPGSEPGSEPGEGFPQPGEPGSEPGEGFPQPGEPGGALDELVEPSQDPAEVAQKRSENRMKIIRARNAAKMCGQLSAGLERLIESAVKIDTDWRAVLRRFFTDKAKTDFSFARPKRRFIAEDMFLPSLQGEKMGVVAVAVDCSGSVDDQLLEAFAAEIKGIIQDVAPTETRVVYFDSEVLKRETYGPDDEVDLKPMGGGGTRFSPIFKALNADETAPIACVVLTDLECSDFGEQPDFPVLWASTTDRETVPFGEVVRVKGE